MTYNPERDEILWSDFLPLHINYKIKTIAKKARISEAKLVCRAVILLEAALAAREEGKDFVLGNELIEFK